MGNWLLGGVIESIGGYIVLALSLTGGLSDAKKRQKVIYLAAAFAVSLNLSVASHYYGVPGYSVLIRDFFNAGMLAVIITAIAAKYSSFLSKKICLINRRFLAT
jgi:hypothetical protein